jgi:threonine dehydrogenase-like Zn-dependent dehydrogenase
VKAAVFHRPGQPLAIETQPDPIPGEHDVVLKVGRCGICGTDLHMTEGHGMTAAAGTVLGHEFAGEVVALGSNVSHLRLGDRVAALPLSGCGDCESCRRGEPQWCAAGYAWRPGGYAEYALADARTCIRLPAALSLADGALVEPMAVAFNAVRLADIQPGVRVAVLGAGPIGLACIYWARRFGAGRIAACAASPRRAELAGQMGADGFFLNDEQAAQRCAELLGGPADVTIECVGLPGMIARGIELTRPRGLLVIAGFCVQPDSFLPVMAGVKQLRMHFAVLYGLADFQAAVDALDAGHVEPRAMITATVTLDQLPEAFEALRQRSAQCKLMLAPWSGHED